MAGRHTPRSHASAGTGWLALGAAAALAAIDAGHFASQPLFSPVANHALQSVLVLLWAWRYARDGKRGNAVEPNANPHARWKTRLAWLFASGFALLMLGADAMSALRDSDAAADNTLDNALATWSGAWLTPMLLVAVGCWQWRLLRRGVAPWLLMVGSLLAVWLAGAWLLRLPRAVPVGQHMPWRDAMFTAASAATCTGMTVRHTAIQLAPFGQAIVLGLFTVGGTLAMLYGSLMVMLTLRRWRGDRDGVMEGDHESPHEQMPSDRYPQGRSSLSQTLVETPSPLARRWLRFGVCMVIIAPLTGAVLAAAIAWHQTPDAMKSNTHRRSNDEARAHVMGEPERFRPAANAAYDAVSAWHQAGFRSAYQPLDPIADRTLLYAIIAPLMLLGGMGLPTLTALAGLFALRGGRSDLACYCRAVLVGVAIVFLAGVAGWCSPMLKGQTLSDTSGKRTLAEASIAVINARTTGLAIEGGFEDAGSNGDEGSDGTIASVRSAITISLATIGGVPGGAAGGLGLLTVGVLLLAGWRDRRHGSADGKSSTTQIALCLRPAAWRWAACYAGIVGAGFTVLRVTEPYATGILLADVLSAASQCGLTLRDGRLSGTGEATLIAAMLLSRLGMLCLTWRWIDRYARPIRSVEPPCR